MKQVPYPNHEQCAAVVQELTEHDAIHGELTDFECGFCESNADRSWFSDRQKEVVRSLAEKYDLKCFP